MKKINFSVLIAAYMLMMCVACGNHDHNHSHDHDHGTQHSCASHNHAHEAAHSHDHAEHSHEHEGCSHEGHSHEGHNHDHAHEGHNHETSSHDHAHDYDHAAESHADGEIVFSAQQAAEAGLQVEVVKKSEFAHVIPATGSLMVAEGAEQTIVAPVSGVVRKAASNLAEGVAVRAGEILYYVEVGTTTEADPVATAKAELDAARSSFERAEKLRNDQLITLQEWEEAQRRLRQAEAAWKGAKRTGGESEGNRMKAVAPVAGYLKSRLVNVGEYVTTGQPLAVVADNSRMRLRAEVSERYIGALSSVASARFRLSSSNQVYSLDECRGTLLSVGRTSDAVSHYVPVTFELDNPAELLAGTHVEVWLLGAPRAEVISLPTSALTEEQGIYYVYVQNDAEHYRKREVKVGQRAGSRVEILNGLHEGERVVTVGAMQVRLASMSASIPHGHSHAH